MHPTERKLNEIAQGLLPWDDGLRWFDTSDADGRTAIMRALYMCISQAHPTIDDIENGVEKSGLKRSYTPCVLLLGQPFNVAREKVMTLGGLDQRRAFIPFLSVFAVADLRRRTTQCQDGCTHEWHNL